MQETPRKTPQNRAEKEGQRTRKQNQTVPCRKQKKKQGKKQCKKHGTKARCSKSYATHRDTGNELEVLGVDLPLLQVPNWVHLLLCLIGVVGLLFSSLRGTSTDTGSGQVAGVRRRTVASAQEVVFRTGVLGSVVVMVMVMRICGCMNTWIHGYMTCN